MSTSLQTSPQARTANISAAVSHITKRYPGVTALDDVSLSFRAGQVHALVGENGAGKSTLMSVLSGSIVADSGTVTVGDHEAPAGDPSWAREQGLAIVHQEPALLPDLTVAENMRLVMPGRLRPHIAAQNRWAAQHLAPWADVARIEPDVLAGRLGPGERFVVEIARAFAAQPRVLVFDEPTEHLLDVGVGVLLGQIRKRADAGVAIVYISHRIREVLQVADVISVLRNGKLRGTDEAAEMTEHELVTRIVGRQLEARFPPKAGVGVDSSGVEGGGGAEGSGGFEHDTVSGSRTILSVTALSGSGFNDVDLEVHRGEILGLAGVEGQGQRELLRALGGLENARGTFTLNGRRVRLRSPTQAARVGIAYLSNDRHREGVITGLNVRENLIARALNTVSRLAVVSSRRERARIAGAIETMGIKTPSSETPIESLSGGNQQKVMMGRLLEARPEVLLVDEPSQGVDVGARADIYAILRQSASEGKAVVVLSSDNSELEGLCDRVVVFSRGQVVREYSGSEVQERNITEAAVTATGSRASHESRIVRGGFAQFLRTRLLPWLVLGLVLIGLGGMAAGKSAYYLTPLNFSLILPMLAVLLMAGLGQQFALLVGGIDLSIGPLMSVIGVTASFVLAPGISSVGLIGGWLIILGVAVGVGLLNWVLSSLFGITPIIATLASYTALQGVALVVRPTPGGSYEPQLLSVLQSKIGFVPITIVVGLVLAIMLELALTRTGIGVKLRAAGSHPSHAHKVGVRVGVMNLIAYLGSAILAAVAGILLLPISGTGNASVGTVYTLSSIAAVVLGGASVFGGRGSFLGAALGAATVVQINSVVTFLGLTSYWQQYLLGGLTLVATAFYSTFAATKGSRRNV